MSVGRSHFGFALVLFVVGVALRPQFAGIPPLLPRIQAEFALPYVVASTLTAIPVLFLGVLAFAGPWAALRYGTGRAILLTLLVILVFSLLRAASPDGWVLLALTLPVGAAIGLASALVPTAAGPLPSRPRSTAVAVYTMGLQVGTGGAAAIAGYLASAFDSWRVALVLMALPLALALWGWQWWRAERPPREITPIDVPAGLPRQGLLLPVLVFGTQSAAFISTATWLPAHLQASGWGESEAGLSLGLLNAVALVGTLLVAVRVRSPMARRWAIAISAVLLACSLALIALAPDTAFIWVSVAGLAFGVLFPVGMTLPLDLGADARESLRLTASTLGYGYLLAALTSFVTGWIRDVTGSFVPVFLVLVLSGPVLAYTSIALRRPTSRAA